MSDCFGMCFIQVESFQDALLKAALITRRLSQKEIMKSIIKENAHSIPSIFFDAIKNDSSFQYMAGIADKEWLYRIFKNDFVYWESKNLMGYSFFHPNFVKDLVDGHILFSGFTCQNPKFPLCVDKIEYFRKVALNQPFEKTAANWYEKIYEELELNDWLYGKENPTFERFSFNSLTTSEMEFYLSTYIKLLKKEMYMN